MPRAPKYSEAAILTAASTLVANGGPQAATMAAIGQAVGAANGSLYHRFASRDALLGRLWLDKAAFFQDRWETAFAASDPRQAGLAAALSLPRTARADLEGARIMLLHRREDFLSDGWPSEMRVEARRLGEQVTAFLDQAAARLFGSRSAAAKRATVFAVLEIPLAATRRYVVAGKAPPIEIEPLITTAYNAVIEAGI